MSVAKKLRQDIKSGPMIVAPGAYDCITAMLIKEGYLHAEPFAAASS
jgi:2-methylisocitrate lyase-like PEP mutase family enzyme